MRRRRNRDHYQQRKLSGTFALRQTDQVGAAAAEQDDGFLKSCFVDTGMLAALQDCSAPARIVVGRTGSGKTALLSMLIDRSQHVIELQPESLALSYITNSTILKSIQGLGVKLDVFFRLLWRHVFTVELLRTHLSLHTEQQTTKFLWGIFSRNDDRSKHKRALKYLQDWGKSFWEDTEYRIKEVTNKLETDVSTEIGVDAAGVLAKAGGAMRLTEEQKIEVAKRAQAVVNNVQISALSEIINTIRDILDEDGREYFIVVDRLDEDWVDDEFRYRLIRALIETVKDFTKVRKAKIVVALRYDLLERVFRLTRDAGFQEEKYESLMLHLRWNRSSLIELIDRRIAHMVKDRYTKAAVCARDILPSSIQKQDSLEYILERTLERPRDVIQFFNICIPLAAPHARVTAPDVRSAEGEFSRKRIRALADEWYADYPSLMRFSALLKERSFTFQIGSITNDDVEAFCLHETLQGLNIDDDLSSAANSVIQGTCTPGDFRRIFAKVMFLTGVVGLRLEKSNGIVWAVSGFRIISEAEISEEAMICVHPCFWRTLGVHDPSRRYAK